MFTPKNIAFAYVSRGQCHFYLMIMFFSTSVIGLHFCTSHLPLSHPIIYLQMPPFIFTFTRGWFIFSPQPQGASQGFFFSPVGPSWGWLTLKSLFCSAFYTLLFLLWPSYFCQKTIFTFHAFKVIAPSYDFLPYSTKAFLLPIL